jgi:acyl-CoA thioester hydrolase
MGIINLSVKRLTGAFIFELDSFDKIKKEKYNNILLASKEMGDNMIIVREKVRFVETDMMGVVHHANYFRWFEMGRVEYLRQAGILLWDLMDDGYVFPITEVSGKYKASAKFDDIILIETKMTDFSKAKMVFSYNVRREKDGDLLTIGHSQNVFTDKAGKIVRLPDKYYEKLLAASKADKEE